MSILTGTWSGVFTYGENYPENISGKEVAFQVEMTEQEGDLQGLCQDDCLKEQPSTISGFRDEDFVSFIKTYAYYIGMDEEGNIIPNREAPAHQVHYSGTWDGESIQGVFEFGDHIVFARSEEVYECGTFIMKKADTVHPL